MTGSGSIIGDPVDNNISGPGAENMNYSDVSSSQDDSHVSPRVPEPDLVSNVVDLTGLRHTSEQSRLQTDDFNLINHENLEEDEEEPDITAVRRAVADDNEEDNDIDNADNLVGLRAQIDKTLNFVADQRIEAGQANLKTLNEIPGRLPRNQRNFAAQIKDSKEDDIEEEVEDDKDDEEVNKIDLDYDEELEEDEDTLCTNLKCCISIHAVEKRAARKKRKESEEGRRRRRKTLLDFL